MESSLKGLLIAVGVIVVGLVISLGFFLVNSGQEVSGSLAGQFNKVSTSIQESGRTKYDGAVVKGSEVVNCIRKFQEELTINVTRKDASGVIKPMISFHGSGSIINLPSDANYINPNASFRGTVKRNQNEAINSIDFMQVKGITDAEAGEGSSGGGGSGESGGSGSDSGNSGGSSNSDAQIGTLIDALADQQKILDELMKSLGEMKDTIGDLQGNQTSNDEFITKLEKNVNSLTLAVNIISEKLASMESKPGYDDSEIRKSIEELQKTIASVTEKLSEVDTTTENFSSTVEDLKSIIDSLNIKIKELEETVNSSGGGSSYDPNEEVTYEQYKTRGYFFTDESKTWTVPKGCHEVRISACASGLETKAGGAIVEQTYVVQPGQKVDISITYKGDTVITFGKKAITLKAGTYDGYFDDNHTGEFLKWKYGDYAESDSGEVGHYGHYSYSGLAGKGGKGGEGGYFGWGGGGGGGAGTYSDKSYGKGGKGGCHTAGQYGGAAYIGEEGNWGNSATGGKGGNAAGYGAGGGQGGECLNQEEKPSGVYAQNGEPSGGMVFFSYIWLDIPNDMRP